MVIYRNKRRQIKWNVWEDQQNRGKIKWTDNHNNESFIFYCIVVTIFYQLFYLFYHRFGTRCFSNAICFEVTLGSSENISKVLKTFLSIFIFIFIYSSVPFDWKNPIGYFFGFAFQAATAFYIDFLSPYHTSFIAGICLMLMTLAQDLKNDLLTINSLAKNRSKLLKNISSLVRFHSECKQLSDGVDRLIYTTIGTKKFGQFSFVTGWFFFEKLLNDIFQYFSFCLIFKALPVFGTYRGYTIYPSYE